MVRLLACISAVGLLALLVVFDRPPSSALGPSNGRWVDIGPAPLVGGQIGLIGHERPVTGRVSAVAVNPGDGNHWLAGGAVGGVWESTNAGRSWTPLTDNAPSLAIGAVAFAPRHPDVAYVGTGEGLAGTGALSGRGMLRLDRDGGRGTWTVTSVGADEAPRNGCAKVAFSGLGFSAIVVDPGNAEHVVAATRHVGTDPENNSVDLHGTLIPRDPCKRGIVSLENGRWGEIPELRGDATDLVVHPEARSDRTYFGCMYAGLSRSSTITTAEIPDDDNKKPMPGLYRRRGAACRSGHPAVSKPLPDDCRTHTTKIGEWVRIDGPWDHAACAMIPRPASDLWQNNWDLFLARTRIAIARNKPDTVYVGVSTQLVERASVVKPDQDARLLGLWRTKNAWSDTPQWIRIPVGATDGGAGAFGYCASNPPTGLQMQCNWNHILSVDPNNADVIYAGGVGLWRGTIVCERTRQDGDGRTLADDCIHWVEVSQTLAPHPPTPRLRRIGMHVDHHAMGWTPDGRRFIVGNDGGVWSTTDAGRNWNAHNHGLSVMQFYRGAVADASDGAGPIMLGGTQDNGVARWRGGAWDWVLGGDGGAALISTKNPEMQWAVTTTSVLFKKRLRRSVDGGKQFPFADDPSLIDEGEPSLDVLMKPLAACPHNDDIVIIAGNGKPPSSTVKLEAIWKSESFFTTAASPTWRPDFTKQQVDIKTQGTISAAAFARFDPSCKTYAFGTKLGAVWLTRTGGKFWCNIGTGLRGPATKRVTGMAFDETGQLYVSLVDTTSNLVGLVERTVKPVPECAMDGAPNIVWEDLNLVRPTQGNPGCVPDSVTVRRRADDQEPSCADGSRIADDREQVTTIAIHPRVRNKIYAGTNSGLWVSDDAGATWTRHDHKTYGMPNVPVLDIKISPEEGHVVAFTYGRGAFLWKENGWCDGKPSPVIGTNFRPCPR